MSALLSSETAAAPASLADRLGICVSALCLVQCLALPVLLVAAPAASLWRGEVVHLALLAVVIPVSVVAFAGGYRVHRDARVLWPAAAGLVLLAGAAALDLMALAGPWMVAAVSIPGAAALIGAHLANLRLRRRACLHSRR